MRIAAADDTASAPPPIRWRHHVTGLDVSQGCQNIANRDYRKINYLQLTFNALEYFLLY